MKTGRAVGEVVKIDVVMVCNRNKQIRTQLCGELIGFRPPTASIRRLITSEFLAELRKGY